MSNERNKQLDCVGYSTKRTRYRKAEREKSKGHPIKEAAMAIKTITKLKIRNIAKQLALLRFFYLFTIFLAKTLKYAI